MKHSFEPAEEYREFFLRPAPKPTVDAIIVDADRLLLIRRKNPPPGWALPGGFVDVGESCEHAVIRETREETGLTVMRLAQFHTYSSPDRDPRIPTLGTIFVTEVRGDVKAADDAAEARFFALDELPEPIPFDHRQIIQDFVDQKYPYIWQAADEIRR